MYLLGVGMVRQFIHATLSTYYPKIRPFTFRKWIKRLLLLVLTFAWMFTWALRAQLNKCREPIPLSDCPYMSVCSYFSFPSSVEKISKHIHLVSLPSFSLFTCNKSWDFLGQLVENNLGLIYKPEQDVTLRNGQIFKKQKEATFKNYLNTLLLLFFLFFFNS